jgi:hypothetical protein
MIPVMIVDTSLAVAGTVSGRGKSPTGLGVGGVPLSTLRRGIGCPVVTGLFGEGGVIGWMTVGGSGRGVSVGEGVGRVIVVG